jgi:hypothetical protein
MLTESFTARDPFRTSMVGVSLPKKAYTLQILRPPCRQPRAISQQRANSSAPRQAGPSFSLNTRIGLAPRSTVSVTRPNYNFGHQRKTSVLVNLRQPRAVITSQCAPRAGTTRKLRWNGRRRFSWLGAQRYRRTRRPFIGAKPLEPARSRRA